MIIPLVYHTARVLTVSVKLPISSIALPLVVALLPYVLSYRGVLWNGVAVDSEVDDAAFFVVVCWHRVSTGHVYL